MVDVAFGLHSMHLIRLGEFSQAFVYSLHVFFNGLCLELCCLCRPGLSGAVFIVFGVDVLDGKEQFFLPDYPVLHLPSSALSIPQFLH